ncbi:MAG: peptidase [Tepidisphaerales bacterium]
MTYCLGIKTRYGLVMASDSRTNAGVDLVDTTRKMHTFTIPGQRVFVLLASGSLSCTQSCLTLLQREFDQGGGLASCETMYDAARVVGNTMRKVADIDRPALERDGLSFNVHFILGGQIKGQPVGLYLLYPQGNPLSATEDSPYLQIGEVKYGRPILDRGIQYDKTTLEDACKLALLSIDSTMKSNLTVGPPIDLLAYENDDLEIRNYRRFGKDDPDLSKIRSRWEAALRASILKLPQIKLHDDGKAIPGRTIELVEGQEGGATVGDAQSSQSSVPLKQAGA